MSSKSPVVAWVNIPRAPHIQDRKLWSFSIALSVAGFGLYALHKQEHVYEFATKLRGAVRAGRNAVDVMAKIAQVSGSVLSDIQLYLESDSTAEVPQTLRQISTLLSTQEFRNATRSLVMTFFEGLALSGGDQSTVRNQDVFENLVERLIVRATRRTDLLSIAVRLVTRNAADELLQLLSVLKKPMNGSGRSHGNTPLDVLLSRVATENGRKVMSTVVNAFTSTVVTVCIEKSQGVDTWDEIFRVIARPNNLRLIQQLTGVSAREFARTVSDIVTESRPRKMPEPMTSEITAEVDYTQQPVVATALCSAPARHYIPQHSKTTQAVSNLIDAFATVARNEESRAMFYQFCGHALAEVIKVLLQDFIKWLKHSPIADWFIFLATLLFEFLLFCSIPLLHVHITGYSIVTYAPEGE